MRFYSTTFFCDKGRHAKFSMSALDNITYVLLINESGAHYDNPKVTIFFDNEQDLVNCKNSLISAYESFERKEKGHA